MTLYDAIMIYGKLADIFKVKFQESVTFQHSLKLNTSDSLTKEEMKEARKYVAIRETIKSLTRMREALKEILHQHITKFQTAVKTAATNNSKAPDVFSFQLDNETDVKSLQSIFSPEMNKALMGNTFIQAAFQLRRSVSELLKNEHEFVANCEKIRFDKLCSILQKYEEIDPTSEEVLALNYLGKNYYCISNSLQISIDELNQFCKNIFSICTFLHQKFGSEEFQRSFSALADIAKNYRILLRRITNVQAKLDVTDPDYIFLADFQAIIIQPVQRTMRYKLTLTEICKYCSILLSDEADNLYIPLRAKNGKEELSKEVVKTLIPNIISTIDTQVKNINIEIYLLESIDKINDKKEKLMKKIDPNPIFF